MLPRVEQVRIDLPNPSRVARERAQRLLERALGPSKVLIAPGEIEAFATDDSNCHGQTPDAVVFAETAADVQATLAVAERTGVPLTPRGAGTGRTGGATTLAGGIVLSLTNMNRIVDIDRQEGIALVEPGVVLADLQRAVELEGWFYPPDPNSAAHCVLGGNVAENAAGPRALKYGPTRDYVLGLDACLMGGQRLGMGRRTKKGVTGYDVTSLVVGSEGTLAVVDRITLRLLPKPEQVITLSAYFQHFEQAAALIAELLAEGVPLSTAEFMDDVTLGVMREAGTPCPAAAKAMLILEVDGHEATCERGALQIQAACERLQALELLVAQGANQRAKLWDARKQMSYAVRRLARHKLSEDVVVPRTALGRLLSGVRELGQRHRVQTLSYGHAGDGNLHVNFLWNEDSEKPRVNAAIDELFRLTIALGGTLSGEHGIGALKAGYLPLEQSPELIALQRDIKRVFDPSGLLNPGKIFPAGHRAC